jgi:Uma2 family endonuclease
MECFRLNEQGFWELHPYGEGDEFELTSIDFRCSLDVVYEDVILEESETD